MNEWLFVRSADRLALADAVAALILLEDGRYVMQLRDPLPHIFFPDHWGCFGGAVNPGEQPLAALKREVHEELDLDVRDAVEFASLDFDLAPVGLAKVYRTYFEVRISEAEFAACRLHEGADFAAFDGAEFLVRKRITPYDAFAVWLHMNQARLR